MKILDIEFSKFISKNKNKIIVFTGILDNFSPDDTIYELEAEYKFMLNVPLHEILRRYYSRLCSEPVDFWNKVTERVYNIDSSREKIDSYWKHIEWHVSHGYSLMSDEEIIIKIGLLINDYNKLKNTDVKST